MTQQQFDELHHEALMMISEKEYDVAENLFRTLLLHDYERNITLLGYAHIAFQKKDYHAAIDLAFRALEVEKEEAKEYARQKPISYSRYYRVIGKSYLGFAEQYPQKTDHYMRLARPYLETILKETEAEEFTERKGVMFYMARLKEYTWILERFGEHEAALAYAFEAIEKYPYNAQSYLLVSEILMMQSAYTQALALCKKAQILAPGDARVHSAMEKCRREINNEQT